MDTGLFFQAVGPPSHLFLFWPGTPEPSWDCDVPEKAFKNDPKLSQMRVSAEYLRCCLCRIPYVK